MLVQKNTKRIGCILITYDKFVLPFSTVEKSLSTIVLLVSKLLGDRYQNTAGNPTRSSVI